MMIDNDPVIDEDFITSLQSEEVFRALTAMGHDVSCPVCKHDHYTLATAEGRLCIASTSLISHEGNSLWFFPLMCKKCGTTRMVESLRVAAMVLEGRKNA